jgi:DNA-binding NarL/FixJ family response regulator
MSKIRVLLADDHQAILQQVCSLLGEDFEIVGTANNGRAAVVATLRLNPDVLVIDISMPVLNGLEATQQLHHAKQATKIVFLDDSPGRGFRRCSSFGRRVGVRNEVRCRN